VGSAGNWQARPSRKGGDPQKRTHRGKTESVTAWTILGKDASAYPNKKMEEEEEEEEII
jgi:hypothetical protein